MARVGLIGSFVLAAVAVASAQPRGFEQPWLGVALAPGKAGVTVKQVVPDTPADRAGLLQGDEIVAVDGHRTATTHELIDVVGGYRVGDEVALSVRRDGKPVGVRATLAARMTGSELVRKVLIDKPAPAFELGVVAGTGGGKLADYRGKVLIVEFFSVTCKYCPLAHRALARATRQHAADGLAAVAVSADPRAALANYLDPDYAPKQTVYKTRYGTRTITEPHHGPLGFPALHDATGEVKAAYWVSGFPTVVVIDRDGYVRRIANGAGRATDEAIAAAVALLDESK